LNHGKPNGISILQLVRSRLWIDEFNNTDYSTMVKKTNAISKLIERIIETKRPKLAHIVHSQPWLIRLLSAWLPSRFVDRLIVRKLSS